MPSVSVVITTHNRVQLLQRAIESVRHAGSDLMASDLKGSNLAGSEPAGFELEIIVVDDCSTDETPEVCAKLPDIRYVRLSSNHGLAYARNVGIAESSSEFIAFLDDDDLRLPGSLAKQLCVLKAAEGTIKSAALSSLVVTMTCCIVYTRHWRHSYDSRRQRSLSPSDQSARVESRGPADRQNHPAHPSI